MAQFEPKIAEITAFGGQLVHIAAEKREGMWKPSRFLAKHPISVPFLLDEDRSVTKEYGLYHRMGKDAIHVAHPATLVINPRGTVQYIYRGDNQNDRAPVEQVIEAIRNLK